MVHDYIQLLRNTLELYTWVSYPFGIFSSLNSSSFHPLWDSLDGQEVYSSQLNPVDGAVNMQDSTIPKTPRTPEVHTLMLQSFSQPQASAYSQMCLFLQSDWLATCAWQWDLDIWANFLSLNYLVERRMLYYMYAFMSSYYYELVELGMRDAAVWDAGMEWNGDNSLELKYCWALCCSNTTAYRPVCWVISEILAYSFSRIITLMANCCSCSQIEGKSITDVVAQHR